jgi:hypothetical protein
MAGNPLAFLIPHIKKNAIVIYLIGGPLLLLLHRSRINNLYKSLYSENDYQRRVNFEKCKKALSEKH